MKKPILFSIFLISFFGNAQVTIVEENTKNNKISISTHFFPESNSMFIFKGKGLETYSIDSYGIDGIRKDFINNVKLYGNIFSKSDKILMASDISLGIYKAKTKYIVNGKLLDSDFDDRRYIQYVSENFFTSKYAFSLKNQKGKYDIDLLKDDINLIVTDIFNKKSVVSKIEKPNLDKLVGPNFIKAKEDLGFKLTINYDETIDFLTKSISKDYTNSILYKTRISHEGKKINELVYDLKIPNHVFIYSNNGGGKFTIGGSDNKFKHFGDDLSINNYIEDASNGDIYIFGLYGDELGKLNDMANPKGYYIFKFDKSGKNIWESINKIDDADFNKGHVMTTVFVDLVNLNDNVCLSIRVNGLKDFFGYSIIDKVKGSIKKSENLEINETFAHLDDTDNNRFNINSNFKNLKELKNKKFNFNSLIAFNSNPKFAEYIKNLKSENNIYLHSQFSDKGIWLYESAENEYYKLTLFKD